MRMRVIIRSLLVSASAVLFLTAAAPVASAQDFGEARHWTISAERMFGFVHTSASAGEISQSRDQFTLLANPLGGASGYSWPRVAFDLFVAPQVSVGGSVAVTHVEFPSDSLTGVLLAPRAGYAAFLSSRVVIWPRAGLTYEYLTSESGNGAVTLSSHNSGLALTLEAPLLILLPPRVALTFGPAVDVGLMGNSSAGSASIDTRTTDFGVHAGLLLYL